MGQKFKEVYSDITEARRCGSTPIMPLHRRHLKYCWI
jgi:hypothetical protein